MRKPLALFLLGAVLGLGGVACGGDDTPPVEASDQDLSSWRASYAELAHAKVPKAFDEVLAGLAKFDDETMPHEAKALRKKIGELRDYVDLFAFAYSKAGPGDSGAGRRSSPSSKTPVSRT